MHPYKSIKVQALKPEDYRRRVEFFETIIIRIQKDLEVLKKFFLTDGQDNFSFDVFCLLRVDKIEYHIHNEWLNAEKYLQVIKRVDRDFLDNLSSKDYRTCLFQLQGAPVHCTGVVTREL